MVKKYNNKTLYGYVRYKEEKLGINLAEYYKENKGKNLCLAPTTIYALQYRKPSDLTYTILSQLLEVDISYLKRFPIKWVNKGY